jgi:hypothetical protein
LTIATNGNITDLIVNAVSGPGAPLPDVVDHISSQVIYLDGAALTNTVVTAGGANSANITGLGGGVTVSIDLLLQGGATSGDDPDGHYTAKVVKKISITDTAGGGSHSLVLIDDASLTRLVATGGFATGPSTENAVFSSSGTATTNNTVTQTETGDVRGFLISEKTTQIFTLEDLDRDGQVSTLDLGALLSNFGGSASDAGDGDLDGDGNVTTLDLGQLLTTFGSSYPDHVEAVSDDSSAAQATSGSDLRDLTSTSASGPNTGADINTGFQIDFGLVAGETRTFIVEEMITPEPASLALVGLGATLLVGRRSRRNR